MEINWNSSTRLPGSVWPSMPALLRAAADQWIAAGDASRQEIVQMFEDAARQSPETITIKLSDVPGHLTPDPELLGQLLRWAKSCNANVHVVPKATGVGDTSLGDRTVQAGNPNKRTRSEFEGRTTNSPRGNSAHAGERGDPPPTGGLSGWPPTGPTNNNTVLAARDNIDLLEIAIADWVASSTTTRDTTTDAGQIIMDAVNESLRTGVLRIDLSEHLDTAAQLPPAIRQALAAFMRRMQMPGCNIYSKQTPPPRRSGTNTDVTAVPQTRLADRTAATTNNSNARTNVQNASTNNVPAALEAPSAGGAAPTTNNSRAEANVQKDIPHRVYSYPDFFEFDSTVRKVKRNGGIVRLSDNAAKCLHTFVARPREDLSATDVGVPQAAFQQLIGQVRNAIGDDAGTMIVALSRVRYKFIPPDKQSNRSVEFANMTNAGPSNPTGVGYSWSNDGYAYMLDSASGTVFRDGERVALNSDNDFKVLQAFVRNSGVTLSVSGWAAKCGLSKGSAGSSIRRLRDDLREGPSKLWTAIERHKEDYTFLPPVSEVAAEDNASAGESARGTSS